MTLYLSIIGTLVFLLLWGFAWRKRPILAFGVFLGFVAASVVGSLAWPDRIEHVPAWLPALPFAVVAIALFCFGFLAWHWGKDR